MNSFQMSYWFQRLEIFITCLFTINVSLVKCNEPLLLYSTAKDIRIVNSVKANNTKLKPTVLIRNLTDGAALDYHYAKKQICWTDHSLEVIQCATYDGVEAKNKIEVISSGNGLLSPDGLACDWFTDKLYWMDSETNRIEVVTMTGKHRKVLYWTDIDQPRAIALVPMKGFMFWSDWGEVPKIERAGMNGDSSTRKVIISDKIFWPNGLTVDYEAESVYWIDGKLLFIDVMDYDGKNRKTILRNGLEYPFALTQFQNKFFWTDWKSWSIQFYDSNSSNHSKEFVHSDFVPMDIHVYDSRVQPRLPHPCERNNGDCSHLCLLAPNFPGYTCACPIGIKLIDDRTCASGPQELLILALRTDICIVYLDSPDYTLKILPLTDIKYSIAVDYDPVEDYIYWTDDEVKKIQRVHLNGTDQTDVIVSEISHPDGVAVDWVARNIYWTDAGIDRIEVARLNGSYRRVIISEGLLNPRAIAVAPQLGWMFWSDWNEKSPKIERANLDGTERKAIVEKHLGWPNGITLDMSLMRIYWCDAKLDRIEYANMDGTDRRILISDNLPHSFGFTLLGEYLYWTDWQRRAIDRVHKETGGGREIITDQIANIMGLKAIRLGEVNGTNPCGINNGGCSHICLYRHNKTYVCTCQIGYELTKDRHKCVVPDAFLLYTHKDKIGRISIENDNNEMIVPITGIKYASSIDFDIANKRIYWSDSKLKAIMRAYVNGSDPQRVIELGLMSPDGIAVDWIAQNIYWVDSTANHIEVARLSGTNRRTLLWRDIDNPHSIALHPQEGYIYWSEWGRIKSIKKAAMDGTNQQTLILKAFSAIGLTIDYEEKRLYWAEPNTPAIMSSDLNGLDKRVIIKEDIFKPNTLTLYKEYIYWSDESTGDLSKAIKSNGSNPMKIYNMHEKITDLLVYYLSKQEGLNKCSVNNGGCSHLCLARPSQTINETLSFTCACPTHFTLQNNTCTAPNQFMLYSQRNLVVRLLPDTSDCTEAFLPVQGLKGVKAIDFDPVNHYLYWIEGKSHSIRRALDSGLHVSVVVAGIQGQHPFDIAIDAIGRLLFWSCAAQDVINVTRLDNNSAVGVVVQKDGEQPRLLAIHPTKRLLFYTNIGIVPSLIRTRLDGTQKIVIFKGSDIAAIAVDADNEVVVWAQGQNIYMSNIDGDNQYVVLNESNSKITQLAIYSGWLYWLDKQIQQLQGRELKTGGSNSVVISHSSLIDLVSIKQVDYNHSCSPASRKCSHLCVMNGTSAACACPHGLALQDDKKTCAALPDCGSEHFTCSTQTQSSKDCIPFAWRCDGQTDCADGSDEAGCPTCKNTQFRCSNGQCIEKKEVCDGVTQCPDGYDEAHCCKVSEEFQCPRTAVCIPVSQLCDGMEHCADGADERKSVCLEAKSETSSRGGTNTAIIVIFTIASVVVGFSVIFFYLRKRCANNEAPLNDHSEDPLNPQQLRAQIKMQNKIRKAFPAGIPDVVHMSMINGSHSSSYDRNHITGASSSTNGSSLLCYPRETLNPPPSPVTTAASTRGSSPSSRYRPYRHYRVINQPPPPTPCSTDVCDESDYNYPMRSRYDAGPFPPPPTPRSHCQSESCPPSPSSRSSTYFSPLPPPPSPVPSPTD